MRIFSTAVAAAFLASALAAPGGAQVLTRRDISLQLSRIIADAAFAQCARDGFDVTVAIVDRNGDMKFLLRADSANPHNLDLARRKAYTSRTFGISSLAFSARSAAGQPLEGQRQLVDAIALGGGLPIVAGMDRIGGIGVSGATSQEADEKCAQAGIAAAANQLR